MYTSMATVLKPVEGKRFSIKKFTLTKEFVKHEKTMAMFGGFERYREVQGLEPGDYVKLVDKQAQQIVMSDTWMEKETNKPFVTRAHGDVLVAGLGIGMILLPLLQNELVRSITVLEKHQEVYDLLRQSCAFVKHPKVKVIIADCRTWKPRTIDRPGMELDGRWHVIYFDIWNNISSDNWEEMKTLKRLYRKYLLKHEGQWVGCWREVHTQKMAAEERADERMWAPIRTSRLSATSPNKSNKPKEAKRP